MLVDDAVGDGQPQPGPLACVLRGKKGLEDALPCFFIESRSGVRHGDDRVIPRRPQSISRRMLPVQLLHRGLDHERPSGRHGIPGIRGEVDQHLLELHAVGHDGHVRALQHGLERYVLADQVHQEFLHPADDGIQIHRLGMQDLLSAEGKDALGQPGGSFRGLEHVFGVGALFVVALHLFEQQVPVPEDRGQDIVEVMGNAPGQQADGFHLLRLQELLLELLLLGHIPDHAPEAPDLPLPVAQGRAGDDHPELVAFLALHLHFIVLGVVRLAHDLDELFPVMPVDVKVPPDVDREKLFLRGIPEQLHAGGIDVEELPIRRTDVEYVFRLLEQGPELFR